MNKIKAAIIEDEVPAARLLHEMIQSLRPDWEVMILPGTIEESVEWFHVNPHPELLFLDIQLTDGNSFMLIEQARPDSMIAGSYTHLRAHETGRNLVCRLLLEKKSRKTQKEE